MHIKALFCIFTLCFFMACDRSPDVPVERTMQSILDREIVSHHIHGVSAAVIFPDGKTWTGSGGVSHDTVAMSPDMLFATGSVTKNVMAALTMKLAEEGVLSLDDSLSKWLPAYTHVDGHITVRQLLNHTSGLYMFWENDMLWEELKRDRERFWTPEEVLEYIREPHFAPGKGWRYSNTNYLLLAMLLEKATDSTLSALFRQYFWHPLDLKSPVLSQQEVLPENLAHVYGDNFQFGEIERDITFLPRTSHESIGFGSSGLFMTAEDLVRWCHALFEGKVLTERSLHEMLQFVEFNPVANMRAYGLGVQLYTRRFASCKRAVGHGGGNIGTTTYMVHLPDYHISIVVMINAFPNTGADTIARGLIRTVLKQEGALGILPCIDFPPVPVLVICVSLSLMAASLLRIWKKRKKSVPHDSH
ncbi:beta-lactamase family protein [bacterium]|nr:beta-lactamase family protein [bacterium]